MNGNFQKLKLLKKVKESELVSSLYLQPVDCLPLQDFKPGQHLLFKIKPQSQDHYIQRFYSFSESPGKECYRISIKKELPPKDLPEVDPGIGSSYLHEEITEGQVIEAKGPMGDFYLDYNKSNTIVLLAGGIGITPLLSMINSIAESENKKEVWLFYGVTNSTDHAFKKHLELLTIEHKNIHITTFYSSPQSEDEIGIDYHYSGFIQMDIIIKSLPMEVIDYYICGPHLMMEYVIAKLVKYGVKKDHIFTESFGPTSQSYINIENKNSSEVPQEIAFTESEVVVEWDNKYKSIVELAEANGVEISVGCLFGDCGTCMTELVEGHVKYNHKTMIEPDPGTCLPCSCQPDGSIVLEI